MDIFDNHIKLVKDDLSKTIIPKSKLSIAASCFSIYAYEELKKELNSIDELRFLFTSPTFVEENFPKEKREFYIPKLSRERSVYGNEFLDDISDDNIANEATGFKGSKIWNKMYDFQKDAALAVINKLETYNGCILADSVGLGKTFTALGVIKYYENRNKSVLVLCPKKLKYIFAILFVRLE